MSLNAEKVLEINITTNEKSIILEYLRKYLLENPKSKIQNPKNRIKPLVIATPNPEQVMLAQKHESFRKILNQADISIPDGIGVVIAHRLIFPKSQLTRISGVDFMEDLIKLADKQGLAVGLIGGYKNVAVEALECLTEKYPKLSGWAMEAPEIGERGGELFIQIQNSKFKSQKSGNQKKFNLYQYSQDNKSSITISSIDDFVEKIIDRIIKTDTRMVFVGLGASKQEILISKLKSQILHSTPFDLAQGRSSGQAKSKQVQNYKKSIINNNNLSMKQCNNSMIFMSVGGAFDTISGRIKRAPGWVQSIGLEWLWRLIWEPWRWRRQMALISFIWVVVNEKARSLLGRVNR